MDAASNNSVDDIRDLREKVAYAPVSGRHKVYILDEAHMLSPQAWNAFLKTLEEPPPRTIFVLATTEAQKVLPTVVDRCHRFDFGRPAAEQVATVLRRVAGRGADRHRRRRGGARSPATRPEASGTRSGRSSSSLTYAGGRRIEPDDVLAVLGVADAEQLFGAVDAIIARDPAEALRTAARLAESGRDPGQVLRDLEVHGRELLTVQVLGEVPPELRVTPERDRRLLEQARSLSPTDAVRLLDLISAALDATANGAQARIQLELVLIKAAAPEIDPSVEALMSRVERLEAGQPAGPALRSVAPAAQGPADDGQPSAPPASPAQPEPPARVATANAGPATQAAPAPAEAPPATEPAPEPRVAPAAQGLDLVGAVTAWPAVVDMVRGRNVMLAALLADARPVAVGDRELTIAFPTGAAFLKRKAEQDDYRRITAEALRTVTGSPLTLRYELREEDEAAAAPGDPALSGEELVRRFLEEFDAEELYEDDTDEREAT